MAFLIAVLTLLFYIGVAALAVWCVFIALEKFGIPIPARIAQIVWVLFLIAVVIWVLRSGVMPLLP